MYHITIQTQVTLKISKDETLELRKLPESHQASPNAAPLSAPLSGSSLKATAQLPQCLTQELLSSIDNSWWKWERFCWRSCLENQIFKSYFLMFFYI